MAYELERFEGKIKKQFGKMTGNYKLQINGAIQENRARLKNKWFKNNSLGGAT
jgi:uncharacterized protein YjbJ (UPF0337 family)